MTAFSLKLTPAQYFTTLAYLNGIWAGNYAPQGLWTQYPMRKVAQMARLA